MTSFRNLDGLLGGKDISKGNLEARSTTQKCVLIACPKRGFHWQSVPLLGFYGSVARPGLVTLFWLRERGLRDHTMGPCGDWFVVVGCIRYSNLGISHSLYACVLPSNYP